MRNVEIISLLLCSLILSSEPVSSTNRGKGGRGEGGREGEVGSTYLHRGGRGAWSC
jgi:hypothetical protein